MSSTESNTEVLIGEPLLLLRAIHPEMATPDSMEKYQKAMNILGLRLNNQEDAILRFALRYPKFTSIIDGGLSLFIPQSNLKKRFSVAAAIVESSPESFHLFLNSDAIRFPKWQFLLLGFRSVFTLTVAYLLFKLKGWK